jgi:2-polyprenyl-6-methoxyphenol hydroxylase-like FAD-dependent oxidoreductase
MISVVSPERSAIVIGGSIAGMCAARVLSRYFPQVTIVDADPLGRDGFTRKGVPQSGHPHALSLRGRAELERLFPGTIAALKAAGGLELDQGSEFARYTTRGWVPRFRADHSVLGCSRSLLENTIRRQFRAQVPSVHWLEGQRVQEITVDPAKRDRVSGVSLRASDGTTSWLAAELIVDASGRASRLTQWLERLGLAAPDEQRIDSHACYATRLYEAPAAEKLPQEWWWRGVMIDPDVPDLPRWGMLVPIEGNRWLVTAGGVSHVRPPLDAENWLTYVRELRSPLIAQMLMRAKPLSDVAQSRSTDCRWRRFDRWKNPLHGFLVVGDALACFNPTYGQGITSAAMQAAALDQQLAKHGADSLALQQGFFAAQAAVLQDAWDFAAALDLRWPKTQGARPPLFALQGIITALYDRAAQEDPHVMRRILAIVHAVGNQWQYLRPSLLARVGLALLRLSVRGSVLYRDPAHPALLARASLETSEAHLQTHRT